jgi:hypothetical protein
MKTAVEWLAEHLCNEMNFDYWKAVEQAKEMEKQQMREASCPYVGGWENDEFEYWYNETYKNSEQ